MTDLVGGHTGRIFCVGFDATKARVLSPLIGVRLLTLSCYGQVISCGEDQVSSADAAL